MMKFNYEECWDAAQSGKNPNIKVKNNDILTEGTILRTNISQAL